MLIGILIAPYPQRSPCPQPESTEEIDRRDRPKRRTRLGTQPLTSCESSFLPMNSNLNTQSTLAHGLGCVR